MKARTTSATLNCIQYQFDHRRVADSQRMKENRSVFVVERTARQLFRSNEIIHHIEQVPSESEHIDGSYRQEREHRPECSQNSTVELLGTICIQNLFITCRRQRLTYERCSSTIERTVFVSRHRSIVTCGSLLVDSFLNFFEEIHSSRR
jgi:hypothetical protein